MIDISPRELNFAAALGRVRRRPSLSAGAANALRYHQLSYDGGPHLTFATTDFRVSMVSRLPVEGQDDPWECRVPFDNFNAFASNAQGGKLTLNSGSPKCVRAEKWSPKEIDALRREFFSTYPFHRTQSTTSYPCHELVEVTRTVVVRRATLRDALAFAAPATGEADSDTRLNTCTITAAGEVVAYSGRVFFRAAADPPGFDLNLPVPDAGRLGAWLALIDQTPQAEIEVATGADAQGRVCHQFRTPDQAHSFRMITVPRAVPSEFVQAARQEPPAISGTVPGRMLDEIANLFRHYESSPLRCRFLRGPNQWRLQLSTTGDAPEGGGVLVLEDCQVADEKAAETPLLLSAVHLHHALDRHRSGPLLLSYLPRARTLSLTDNQPASRHHAASGHQSFLRITAVNEPAEGA